MIIPSSLIYISHSRKRFKSFTYMLIGFFTLMIHAVQASYDDFDQACDALLKEAKKTQKDFPEFPGFLEIEGNKEVIYNNQSKKLTIQLLGISENGKLGTYLVKYDGETMLLKKFEKDYPDNKCLMYQGYLPYNYTTINAKKYMLLERGDKIKHKLYPATPGSMDKIIQYFYLCTKYGYKHDIKPDNTILLKITNKKIKFIDLGKIESNHFYNGSMNMAQNVARSLISLRLFPFIKKLSLAFNYVLRDYKDINEYINICSQLDDLPTYHDDANLLYLHEILEKLPKMTLLYGNDQASNEGVAVPSQNLFWEIIGNIATKIMENKKNSSKEDALTLLDNMAKIDDKYPLCNNIWESKKVNNQRYPSLLEALLRMAGAKMKPFDRYLLRLASGAVDSQNIDQIILKLINLKNQKEEGKEKIAVLPSRMSLSFEYDLFNMEEWESFQGLIKNNVESAEWNSFLQKVRKRVLREYCKITNQNSDFFHGMVKLYELLLIMLPLKTSANNLTPFSLQGLRIHKISLDKQLKKLNQGRDCFKSYYKSFEFIEKLTNDNDLQKECKKILKTNMIIALYDYFYDYDSNYYSDYDNSSDDNDDNDDNDSDEDNSKEEKLQLFVNYLEKKEGQLSKLLATLFKDFANNLPEKVEESKHIYKKLISLTGYLEHKLFKKRFEHNNMSFEPNLSQAHKKYNAIQELVKDNSMSDDLSQVISFYQSSFLNKFNILIVDSVKQYFLHPNPKKFYSSEILQKVITEYEGFLAKEMNGQYKLPTQALRALLKAQWPQLKVTAKNSNVKKSSIQDYVIKMEAFIKQYKVYLTPIAYDKMLNKLFTPLKEYINHQGIMDNIKKNLGAELKQYFAEWQEEEIAKLAALPQSTEARKQDEKRPLSSKDKSIIQGFFPDYSFSVQKKIKHLSPPNTIVNNTQDLKENKDDELDSVNNLNSKPFSSFSNDNSENITNIKKVKSNTDDAESVASSPSLINNENSTVLENSSINISNVKNNTNKLGTKLKNIIYMILCYSLVGTFIATIIGLVVKYWPWKQSNIAVEERN